MNSEQKFSPISIWLIILSLGGIILVISAPNSGGLIGTILSIAPFLAMGIVGLTRSSKAGDYAELYRNSWKFMWQQKWIPAIFGAMALIIFLEFLLKSVLTHQPFWDRLYHYGGPLTLWERLQTALQHTLINPDSFLSKFTPATLAISGVLFGLIVLIALIMIRKRLNVILSLSGIAVNPEYVQKLSSLLIALSLLMIIANSVFYAFMMHISLPITRLFPVISILIGLLYFAFLIVINGIFIGGIASSLARLNRGEAINKSTFLQDAVKYFKSSAGVYIFLSLVPIVSSLILPIIVFKLGSASTGILITGGRLWIWAGLLFMFAPFAVVKYNLGGWGAIRRSARDWIANAWDVTSFIAVGYSLIIVPMTVLRAATFAFGLNLLLGASLYFIQTAVSAIISAFMAVAVWEIYSRIQSAGESSAVE